MTIQEQNDHAVLQPEGELTIFEAAELRDAFVMLGAKSGELELSLANVERMDSSSVQLIIAACQAMTLKITNVPPGVREQFEVIGCGKFLHESTESSAGNA